MNYSQFSIWDIFVNIIPGTTVFLLSLTLFPPEYVNRVLSISATFGIGGTFFVIVLSFVVGWVFQHFARVIDQLITKRLFSQGDLWDNEVSSIDDESEKTTFNERYLRGARMYFADESTDTYDELSAELDKDLLKHLTYSHLYDNNIGRSHRFYILMVLSRSLYVMFGLISIGHIIGQVLSYAGHYSMLFSYNESAIFSIVLIIGVYLMYDTRRFMERSRIKTMISDFYVSELTD